MSVRSNIKKASPFFLGFFFAFCTCIYGQNNSILDSIESVYSSGKFQEKDRLKILLKLSEDHGNPEKKLAFSKELIQTAQRIDSIKYVYKGYLQKGTALRLKSDFTQALESYFEAAKIVAEEKMIRETGYVNITIADVYSLMGDYSKSIGYYQTAILLLRQENDSIGVASALLNAGDGYFNQGKLDSAMAFFHESGEIFDALNYEAGIAYNYGNIGMIYAEQGKDAAAKMYINQAILILEKRKDYYPICVYLTYMSDIYTKHNDPTTALAYTQRSLELANRYGLKDQISDAYLQLSKLLDQAGKVKESYNYYKKHIAYKDSVKNISAVQQMANERADFEISQKQLEVDLLNQQKRTQNIIVIATIIASFLIILLALGVYRRYHFIKKTNVIIEAERNRSEGLLLNILPEETALELKQSGKVKAKKFESVTILFTDFEGFTNYAENLLPEVLVKTVDFYYSKFDEIIEKYGLEKIKTVGDSYMCAGGLPFPTKDHSYKMILAALDILDFVNVSKESATKDQVKLNIRIGINTGPVVAGVVGTRKFAYDIWGDAVNVASRMESNSEPGRINISENLYRLVKDDFDCEYRGVIQVKNRGEMKMYFVNGLKYQMPLKEFPKNTSLS